MNDRARPVILSDRELTHILTAMGVQTGVTTLRPGGISGLEHLALVEKLTAAAQE